MARLARIDSLRSVSWGHVSCSRRCLWLLQARDQSLGRSAESSREISRLGDPKGPGFFKVLSWGRLRESNIARVFFEDDTGQRKSAEIG